MQPFKIFSNVLNNRKYYVHVKFNEDNARKYFKQFAFNNI